MIILGIDSSTKSASCAVVQDDLVICDFSLNHKRTHSEKLLEMIDMALKIAKIDISSVDAFAVTKGPGSFTGLRIGLATVKGLCHALNKPCYLVSTLDALYKNVSTSYLKNIIIAPIMDARRNEVYSAAYLNDEKIVKDSAMGIEEFINILSGYNCEKIIFTGDGVTPNKEIIIEKLKDKCDFAPAHLINGSGSAVVFSALEKNNLVDYNNILPEYIRIGTERVKKGE